MSIRWRVLLYVLEIESKCCADKNRDLFIVLYACLTLYMVENWRNRGTAGLNCETISAVPERVPGT